MAIPEAVTTLHRDLRDVFGDRLRSLVAYALGERSGTSPIATLAVVDTLTAGDLRACAERAERWETIGLRTPLLLERGEFERSLDAFPFEFGAILADHVVVAGASPFDGLQVAAADLRRACEVQARSHLLHLRENYIESGATDDGLAALVLRSAPALAGLLKNVGRAEPAYAPPATLKEVARLNDRSHFTSDDARRLFPGYLAEMTQLANDIDRWRHA